MISLETWAEVRYLHGSEGLSQRAIARRLGISRDTVARAIASGSPPKYVRVSGPSAFDPFEPPAEQDNEMAGLVRDLADYDARFGIDFNPDLGNQLDGEGVA